MVQTAGLVLPAGFTAGRNHHPGGAGILRAGVSWRLTGTRIRSATRFTASSHFSPARFCCSIGSQEEPAVGRINSNSDTEAMRPSASSFVRWWMVVVYAIAMAWVEAAVVFYLRSMMHRIEPYQPNPLPVIGGFASVELPREFATLVMLLAVGWLAGRTWRARSATPRSRSACGTFFTTSS